MASGQLPAEIEEFARYLRALTRRLDAGTGWYGVFALRDPKGLRACLDGLEVPPWDVVQSLLQDLSTQRGAGPAQEAAARAATLYRASVAAHDAGPGSREALRDRLDGMLREQRNAARRERDLQTALSTAEATADRERLAAELAWAHDDWRRATARTEELHARLTALPASGARAPVTAPTPPPSPIPTAPASLPRPTAPTGPMPSAPAPAPRPWAPTAGPMPPGTSASAVGPGADASIEPPAQGLRPTPSASARGPWSVAPTVGATPLGNAVGAPTAAVASARPRPRGARFAGAGGGGVAASPPSSPGPPLAERGSEVPATPRGARFAGAYGGEGGGKRRRRDKAADDGRRLAQEAAE
ncbi:hypothetical protein KN815_03480, partial [Streptomyces sp. 4503]|nr:hypothetical protein [Streptomyces niphimycinicus]